MSTPIWCPHCGEVLSVPDGVTTGVASCPGCRGAVDVAVALVDAAMRELSGERPARAAQARPPAAPTRASGAGASAAQSNPQPVRPPQTAPTKPAPRVPASQPARPAAPSPLTTPSPPGAMRPPGPPPAAPVERAASPGSAPPTAASGDLLAGLSAAAYSSGAPLAGSLLPSSALQPKQQGKSWDEGTITLMILGGLAVVMCGGVLTAMTRFDPTRRLLGLRVEGDFYPERGATTVVEEPGVFRITAPGLLKESNSNDRWTTRHFGSYSEITYSIACRKNWINTSDPQFVPGSLTYWLSMDMSTLPGVPKTAVETSRSKYEIAGHPALEVVTQDSRTGVVVHYLYLAINGDMVDICVYHEEYDPEEVAAFFSSLEILAQPTAAPAGAVRSGQPGTP